MKYKNPSILSSLILLFLLTIVTIVFTTCKKENTDPESNCQRCGIADRLPADVVSLETIYVSVEFIDVDNDGDQDLVLGSWGNPGAPADEELLTDRLLLNDGSGYFTDAPLGKMPKKLFSGPGAGATDFAPIDVDNDGYIDLVLASWSASFGTTKLQLLLNDGTGGFTDETSLIENNSGNQVHCGYVLARDVNADGLMDFVTCAGIWGNNGSGFERFNGGSPNDLADMDGDSLPDFINYTYLNQQFIDSGYSGISLSLQGTLILDADVDGDNDIFVAQTMIGPGISALPAKLLINDGTGYYTYAHDSTFSPAPPEFFFMGAGSHLKGADFNGDGLTDIFIQEGGTDLEPFPGGQNRILIRKPDGTFTDETTQRLPIYNDMSHGCAIGDIDNDGDIDIYNNSITGGDLVSPCLLINDGNGYFTEAW